MAVTPSKLHYLPEEPTSAKGEYYEAEYFRRKAQAAESQAAKLNDQLSYLKSRLKRIDELQQKMSVVLGHNSGLLQEITQLNAVLNSKNQKIALLESRLQAFGEDTLLRESRVQREIIGMKQDHFMARGQQEEQIDRLRRQLARVTAQMRELEKQRLHEVQAIKKKSESDRLEDFQAMRRDKQLVSETLQLQLLKLKEMYGVKAQELEDEVRKHYEDVERLGQQINFLKGALNHRQLVKENELRDLVGKYERQLEIVQQEEQRKQQLNRISFDKEAERLRAELNARAANISGLQAKINDLSEISARDRQILLSEKDKLVNELERAVARGVQAAEMERQKERELARSELESRDKAYRQREALLLAESKKLKDLIDSRNEEIAKTHHQLQHQRGLFLADNQRQATTILELKERINRILMQEELQSEAMRSKYMELSQADTKTLLTQLQRMGGDLTQQLRRREKQLEEKDSRIEGLLKDKRTIRLAYQQLLTQLRAELEQVRGQVAQMRKVSADQMSDMAGKLRVQEGVLRSENESVRKELQFSLVARQQLTDVIVAKDKEIEMQNSKFQRVKQTMEEQNRSLQTKIREKEALFVELDNLREKEIQGLRGELLRKERLSEEDRQQFAAKIEQLRRMLESVGKRIEQRERTIMLLTGEKEELARRVGDMERDNRTRMALTEKHQNEAERDYHLQRENAKHFYEEKEAKAKQALEQQLRKSERDRQDLLALLAQKEEQILHFRQKCQSLQAKIIQAMQSAERMKSLEQKVQNLGLDRTILKNVQDMLKRK